MRVLFLNEGALGPQMLGHEALEASMRRSLPGAEGVEARFLSLPPLEGRASRMAGDIRLLRKFDLDFQPPRWHAVQGMRARRLVQAALAEAPADVLHVHSHSISLGLTDLMASVPTVLSVDATIWDWRAQGIWRRVRPRATRATLWPSLAMERRAFRRAASVQAWTGWARDSVLAACPGANVVVNHPGIDLERFRPPVRREPRERLRVLFVGGRFAEKGGEDLLWALEPRLGRDVELEIVTTDKVTERPGVRVRRFGPTDDRLVAAYQQADVMCLPTRGDATPFVVLEAQACGLPVLSTTIGAIPEMLDHGATGVLVPPRDRAALRAALDALLDDEDRRRALGEAGRPWVEAHYDIAHRRPALLQTLADAAAGR